MTAKRIILFALVALFVLAACSPAASRDNSTGTTTDGFFGGGDGSTPLLVLDGSEAEPMPADTYGIAGEEAEAPPASGVGQAQVDRLVIRNATLSLVVADPAKPKQIAALAASLGGFVVTSNTYQASVDAAGNKIMQANLTIRVPSAQLDAALAQMRGLAVEVRSESISGQDVTAEYTDLESHLRNLEAAETKLQQHHGRRHQDRGRAGGLQPTRRTSASQIEQVQGPDEVLRAVGGHVGHQRRPHPRCAQTSRLKSAGGRPQGVAKEAVEALVRSLQGLANVVIWLGIYVLPLALVILVPLYFVLRFFVRRAAQATGLRPVAAQRTEQ